MSHIAGAGLGPEGVEVHAQLDRRVSNVETWFEGLQESVKRVEDEARAGQARLERKLDDQTSVLGSKIDAMAMRWSVGQKTNWGVIATWVGVGVVLVSAVGVSYTRPLEAAVIANGRRIERQEDRWLEDHDRGIRNEERITALRGAPLPAAAGKGATP